MNKRVVAGFVIGVAVAFSYWLLRNPATSLPQNKLDTAAPQTNVMPSTATPQSQYSVTASSVISRVPEPSFTGAPATSPRITTAVTTVPPNPVPNSQPPSGVPPAVLLENMRTTVRQYGLTFGGNPVGTNP